MSPQAQTIKLTRTINAPPSEVYYAFTAAAAWRQWCEADAQTDPRPGGRLYVYTPGYAAVGEFTALEQDKSVAFSWDGQREPPTQVHIALQAQGGGTHVTFAVTGLGSEQAWIETAHLVESAWGRALENLQSVLETGLGVRASEPTFDLPLTAKALAEALRPIQAQLDAELAEIFAGVAESQAAQPPARGEWSAKETLAHLVATERAAHVWAALMTMGLDIDPWGNAVQSWVSAIAEGHPTVSELLEALKRAKAETARMLAALPDEFVAHKGSYTQVGLVFLQKLPAHTRAHFEQIRAAIEAAGQVTILNADWSANDRRTILTQNEERDFMDAVESWKRQELQPFSGWDFSYLSGRMLEEQPPWSYTSRAAALMRQASSVVDMGTGGGERLLELKEHWPRKVVVTEDYAPNVKLATERLAPLGVQVKDAPLTDHAPMPFADGEFDLVLNRHSGFNGAEVARVLAAGGAFLTQQIHGLWAQDLLAAFDAEPPWPEATLANHATKLDAAGLKVVTAEEWSGKLAFGDVGAIVYYLKAIPWLVPGFSVETHVDYLLKLQSRLEGGKELAFEARKYWIEAHKAL